MKIVRHRRGSGAHAGRIAGMRAGATAVSHDFH